MAKPTGKHKTQSAGKRQNTFSLYRSRIPRPSNVMLKSGDRRVLVFDESGTMGPLKPGDGDPRKDFVVVASFVEDAVSMSSVSKRFPKKNTECKYSSTTVKESKPIFEELAKQDFEFTERHRSRRNQSFQTVEGARDFYVNAISEMIDEGASKEPFDVLIDTPPLVASEQLAELCKKKIDEGLKIEWFDVTSSSNSRLLQVHDFVTGAVADDVNGIKSKASLYRKIERKRYVSE